MNIEKTPLVSILTTVFNREKYISECIESVLASTFQDWEMIIVDDQSSDNSVEIARKYEAKDQRIRVYINENNLGDYPNRNQAASYAKGKYIKYLDADDTIYPHGLSIFVETMEQFPDAALGVSQEVVEDYQMYPFQLSPKETYNREFLKRGVLALGPTGTIINREVFNKCGKFTGTRFIGDIEMWCKIAMYYPIVKMVPGLSFWRRHDDQEIDKGIQSHFYLENSYKHTIQVLNHEDNPLDIESRRSAQNIANQKFGRALLRLILIGKKPILALQIARRCNYSLKDFIKAIFI